MEIVTREMSVRQLQWYLERLSWSAWEIEKTIYQIHEGTLADGIKVRWDRELCCIARSGIIL